MRAVSRALFLALLLLLPWATSFTCLFGAYRLDVLPPWHIDAWAVGAATVLVPAVIEGIEALLLWQLWPRRWLLAAGCACWSAWPVFVLLLRTLAALLAEPGEHDEIVTILEGVLAVGLPVLGTLLALVGTYDRPCGLVVALAHLPAQLPVLLVPLLYTDQLSMWGHVPAPTSTLCVHVRCPLDWMDGGYRSCWAEVREHASGPLTGFSHPVAYFGIYCKEDPYQLLEDPRRYGCRAERPWGGGQRDAYVRTVIDTLGL